MAEDIRAGTHSEGQRERIPHRRSCNVETAGAKRIVDIRDGQQSGI